MNNKPVKIIFCLLLCLSLMKCSFDDPSLQGDKNNKTLNIMFVTLCVWEEPVGLFPFPEKNGVPAESLINELMYDDKVVYPRHYLTTTGILEDLTFSITKTEVLSGTFIYRNCDWEPYQGAPFEMDQARIVFKLKPTYSWSDGAMVTPKDSVFTWDYYSGPYWPGIRELCPTTLSYSAIDSTTLEWVGIPGYIPQDIIREFFIPMPRHQLDDILKKQSLLEATNRMGTLIPLGFGPFQVESWDKGKEIVMIPNPYYRGDLKFFKHVFELTIKFFPSREDAQTGITKGDCDILGTDVMDKEWLQKQINRLISDLDKQTTYPEWSPDGN